MTSPAQAPPIVAAKKSSKPADYVVLKRTRDEGADGNETWELIGSFSAPTASKALKEASRKGEGYDEKSTFVAVPIRSWNPVSPKVKTETRVTFA